MKSLRVAPLTLVYLTVGCASPDQLVYSSGFSFANYDYVVVGKPEAIEWNTSLYGMDVEFANLMSRSNMRVIGDKECEALPEEIKKRVLFARMAISATKNYILLTISFDEVVTGKTGASVTSTSKGDIFDLDKRARALEQVSSRLLKAIRKDKGTHVVNERTQR